MALSLENKKAPTASVNTKGALRSRVFETRFRCEAGFQGSQLRRTVQRFRATPRLLVKNKNVSKRNRRRKKKIHNSSQATSQPVLAKKGGLESCSSAIHAVMADIKAVSVERSHRALDEDRVDGIENQHRTPLASSALSTKNVDPWVKYLDGAPPTKTKPEVMDDSQAEIVSKDSEHAKESKLPEVVHLSVKRADDNFLRLEQNLGCELPVCVANRRDVNKPAIEICGSEGVLWRLERTASSLLPAPEHHPIWLWLLDGFHAAARQGCKEAPRIRISLAQMAKDLSRTPNGQWYRDVDEALSRFSRMVIIAGQSLHVPSGHVVSKSGALGTLCNYVSWRTQSAKERESLVDGLEGWVQPGPFVWDSIRSGYLKAVPLLAVRNLQSYVAQRLYLYLSKHCKPGGQFKVSMNKLLPKIPMACSSDQVRKKLKPHHETLLGLDFLACEPVYEGRGRGLMVTYQRHP
ncbi:MAG: hypothetical protein EOO61_03005 [Hymenobacter sp.]|nr:MAG: hypothetical protein EOO61_03005 [Hymenobacter sp.]